MSLIDAFKPWTSQVRRTLGYLRRNGPVGAAQRVFWDRRVSAALDARPFDFVATTNFGSRIEGNTRDFIQRRICYFGVWEPAITEWISSRLQTGDTFIDVGANIGYFSLLASKLVGASGTVVAIEASPDTFMLLERNLARNSATNVRALNIAASDRTGSLEIFDGPASNIGTATTIRHGAGTPKWSVPALSLVDACKADLERARIIKIDVEGGEGAVVAGLRPALAKLRDDCEIILELSPALLEAGRSERDIVALFGEAGFKPYVIANEYHAVYYLAPRYEPLRPLRFPIRGQADVIFSRS